jgi:hypothetical protein
MAEELAIDNTWNLMDTASWKLVMVSASPLDQFARLLQV